MLAEYAGTVRVVAFFAMFARMSASAFCSAPGVSAKKAGVGFGFGETTLFVTMF